MTTIMTLLLTAIIISLLFWLFYKVKTPYYRTDKQKMIQTLEMVLSGQATENDWHITFGLSIRHSEKLETIRQRCVEIEERWYIGNQKPPYLFMTEGLAELDKVLHELTT